jgi:hypothetical protein
VTTVDELVGEVHRLADLVDRSEDERPDIGLLTHRIQVVARASDAEDQRRLHDALGVLEASVIRAMERLGERLKANGAHRHALAAYGSLRPYTSAQHVRSRA